MNQLKHIVGLFFVFLFIGMSSVKSDTGYTERPWERKCGELYYSGYSDKRLCIDKKTAPPDICKELSRMQMEISNLHAKCIRFNALLGSAKRQYVMLFSEALRSRCRDKLDCIESKGAGYCGEISNREDCGDLLSSE